MLQIGVNKMSTFLYIKIFIVSVGLFVSYLILECLHMAFIIWLHPIALLDGMNILGSRHMSKIANTKYILFSNISAVSW